MLNIIEEGLRGQAYVAKLNQEAAKKAKHKEVNKKQYKRLVQEMANNIVNDHFDLIEESQDEEGHICPDTDKMKEIVTIWMYDNLPLYKRKNIIILNDSYKYQPSDMYLPDDLFFEKHENIFQNCIEDIEQEVSELSEDVFWESFPPDDFE